MLVIIVVKWDAIRQVTMYAQTKLIVLNLQKNFNA